MPRPFDRVAASMYLQEAYELVDSLRFRLLRLEDAAARWIAASDIADAQVQAELQDWDVEAFNAALLVASLATLLARSAARSEES
jgi:hypothetical protein